LLTDQNAMSNSHRGPSIEASYHVSVHLTKLFQSRRFLETDQSETRIAVGHIYEKFSIKIAHFVPIH
jgi:phospholipid N-methyltransferase